MHVYAFLDIRHAPTAWAVMRGMLVSARLVPDYSPGCISFMLAGIIFSGDNTRLFNELAIENRRLARHPTRTSRLGGMYFFEERDLALRATEGWGAHFEEQNLFPLDLTPDGKVSRLDSDWITHAETDAAGRINLENCDWIDQYWSGKPRSDQPRWELLCDGLAVVPEVSARRCAYEIVKHQFPECLLAIEMARLACETDGSPAGMITPWLTHRGGETIDLSYWLRDNEYHERRTIEAMSQHPNFGNLANLWHESDAIRLPNFERWMTRFQLGVKMMPDLSSIASVHSIQ